MDPREMEKKRAAEASVEYVRDGMLLGLGSGTTVAYVLELLGEKVKEGLDVRGVPTSERTRAVAERVGIPVVPFERGVPVDLAIDGADEVDPECRMIKGGGGALLREKIVASFADEVIIVVDSSKAVERLGRFPLPVEVVPFGLVPVTARLEAMGIEPVLRTRDGKPFVTDNGNYVLDCPLGAIDDPADLDRRLRGIPGVVETGLFIGLVDRLIVGRPDGVEVREAKAARTSGSSPPSSR